MSRKPDTIIIEPHERGFQSQSRRFAKAWVVQKRGKSMFWGLLLLSLGLLMLVQYIFKLDLPLLKILFGISLVYLGIKMVFSSFGREDVFREMKTVSTDSEAIFSDSEFQYQKSDGESKNSKFTTAFGSSTLDLTDVKPGDKHEPISIQNAFGRTVIKTNPESPLDIKSGLAFGTIEIRGRSQSFFGESQVQVPAKENGKTTEKTEPLKIEINSAFGQVIVD